MNDITIVGAGMVGLCFANLVAPSGLKILVIDAKPLTPELNLPDNPVRVSAINPRSQQVFSELDAWNKMKELRVSPYRNMHVWDSEGQGEISFDSAEIGMSQLGHIIENDVVSYALQQSLLAYDNVSIAAPLSVSSIRIHDDGVSLQSNDTTIKSQLLVGADGANSWVRQQLAFELTMRAYEHKAIVTTVTTEQSHQMTAWQRFLPTGPLAFLPLTEPHQCSIVWSCIPEKADYLLALDDEAFAESLAEVFGRRLGVIKDIGPRASFPLYMRHVNTYTQDRVALIGDAAHTIHPLAGQGVNLGIADAKELAKVILDAIDRQQNYTKHSVLRRYERARKGENTMMIHLMDGFKHLFASDVAMVKSLRNIGMSLTNRITPLKNKIIKSAMGG